MIGTPNFTESLKEAKNLPLNKLSFYKGKASNALRSFLVMYENSVAERTGENLPQLQ